MSAHAYTEDQLVERPAIGLFAELGWTTVAALEETFGATGTLLRENPGTGERKIDPMRSARLPWARPLIENATAAEMLAWDFEEGDGSINTYVWLPDHDYSIIMRKMGDDTRRLITAYWVEFGHERKKLRRKYERRVPT